LSITVTDINDITPAFTTNIYNFAVDEGNNPGTPVDTVTVSKINYYLIIYWSVASFYMRFQ
jgi:hypothetical protein